MRNCCACILEVTNSSGQITCDPLSLVCSCASCMTSLRSNCGGDACIFVVKASLENKTKGI